MSRPLVEKDGPSEHSRKEMGSFLFISLIISAVSIRRLALA